MTTAFAIHDAPEHAPKRPVKNAVQHVAAGPLKIVHPYYDFGPVLSHHCTFNAIIGARGRGKSYGAKRHVIRKAIRKGEQFVVLRRNEKELGFRDLWFTDIEHEFPDWDFKADGNKFVMSPASQRDAKKREWQVIGYAKALSTASKEKSIPYPKVTTIIYEEFLIDKGPVIYLPNEWKLLLDYFSTIDRWQDKTTVLMLANSVTIENPYFASWGVIVGDEEFIKPAQFGGELLVHVDKNENFESSVLNTKFGRMIAGTEYADYSAGNVFNDNTLDLVGDKTAEALHWFNFETDDGKMSIWQDDNTGMLYASSRMPPGQLYLTLLPERLTEQKTLVFPNSPIVKQVMSAYQNKRLFSDNQNTRLIVQGLFKTSR